MPLIPNLPPTAAESSAGPPAETPATAPTAPRGGGGLDASTPGGDDHRPVATEEISGKGAFVFSEHVLAQATGLPPRTLQKNRVKKLARATHWEVVTSVVAYSADGLALALELATGKKIADGSIAGIVIADLEKLCRIPDPADVVPPPAPVEGKVVRFYPNGHLIGIQLPDRLVNIVVRSTANFRKGMTVPVRPAGNGWELARRAPRFFGRW